MSFEFLSTLPARGATAQQLEASQWTSGISIHAPREGSDDFRHFFTRPPTAISIHAPREGSDSFSATKDRTCKTMISIHAPREGSDRRTHRPHHGRPISIHAPREGSDNSALDVRPPGKISIHAPREGSDPEDCSRVSPFGNFYPRSPRGERPGDLGGFIESEKFLSTLPARGATQSAL